MPLVNPRFVRPLGGRVEFTQSSRDTITTFLQRQQDAQEAGGMLLGRLIRDSLDVVIDQITTPAPEDTRTRHSFVRAQGPAQEKVVAAWSQSSRTKIYLGEWHTHPEEDPTPSNTDLANWNKILRDSCVESEHLFFLIAGTKLSRLWQGSVISGQVCQLAGDGLLNHHNP